MATTMSGKWSIKGGSRRFTFKPMAKFPTKRSAPSDTKIDPGKKQTNRERNTTKSRHIRQPGRPNTPTGTAVAKAKAQSANPDAIKSTSKRNTVPKKTTPKFRSTAPKAKMPKPHPGGKPTLGGTRTGGKGSTNLTFPAGHGITNIGV